MYYTYILANDNNKLLYIGVTDNIQRRWYEHKNELIDGYTKRYHIHKLVYVEEYNYIMDAITREKQLKGWIRSKKNELIETLNPNWENLGNHIV